MQQLDPKKFLNFIKSKQINFFAGVPDSLLKNFLSELDPIKQKNHIIAANEANKKGFDDAILLNTSLRVCESTISNIFIFVSVIYNL